MGGVVYLALQRLAFLFACFAFAADLSAQGPTLILDRPPSVEFAESFGLPEQANAFIADEFVVGAAKEDWIIDRIRLWAIATPNAPSPHALGDFVKKISLLGGITPDPSGPNQSGADCDCHNLPVLKSTGIAPDSDRAENGEVEIASGPRIHGLPTWQIDFNDLKWSVPGGRPMEFGVFADTKSGYDWSNLATPSESPARLRVFSRAGRLEGPFKSPSSARINLQVWGHLLARISIRPSGSNLQVILWSAPFLSAEQVDRTSLRFGPGKAGSQSIEEENVLHGAQPALVMVFQPGASGIVPGSINACLTGKRFDGVPFEACDLLPH